MTWKELQDQVLFCEFELNDVEDKLSEIENRDQEATGKAERLMSDVVRAIEDLWGEIDDEIPCSDDSRDPSDGPFLTQEPEESDGFCDCPECCGE